MICKQRQKMTQWKKLVPITDRDGCEHLTETPGLSDNTEATAQPVV